ncbi:MAG TPA: hypothetical protein PLM52_12555 [Tabrizicola sp.]|nr:hypothetical protein [Tabrizicola sp.]
MRANGGFPGTAVNACAGGRKGQARRAGEDQRAGGQGGEGGPFPDEIPIRFGVPDASQNHHVPLLIARFACATCRGSQGR